MTALKCVVEGCDLEYDVVCSFSFYNVNISSDSEQLRQEWIEGAMQEESECLWRHVSLQLCGYHFELDAQGLWIDSPMLPELLTLPEQVVTLSENDKRVADMIRTEHNYCADAKPTEPEEPVSRLNVRTLVDTLGYLSLKNLQRKQLWVARVETERAEASVTQAEQVIAKLQQPKNIIEIIPQNEKSANEAIEETEGEVLHIIDPSNISDNFIYEIAEEQEITMEEVKEIPVVDEREWMVNIIPEETKPKYAYIKHCTTGKKKRHFTSEMNEITLEGDFDNYYILPDADPSVGVEITTSYEPENYIIQEYDHLLLEERPRKRGKEVKEFGKRKKKRENQVKIKQEEEWLVDNSSIVYEEQVEEYEEKKVTPRVRRKNKKYLAYEERATL